MQGSPLGKLEDAFVVIRSTQKEVANMEEDSLREYNACKALDLQIDNEDDVYTVVLTMKLMSEKYRKQMWLVGLQSNNEPG